jgi:ketopantoate reductase
MDKICLETTYAFEDEEYRSISQTILEHFLETDAANLHSINRLFHDKRLDLRRDEGFISLILKKRADIDTINAFIDFIKMQNGELSAFAKIIKTAVESVAEGTRTWQKYRIEDGLVHAVIRLIDSANGDNELTECCLNILDEIYRKRILTDSAISKLLEGAE